MTKSIAIGVFVAITLLSPRVSAHVNLLSPNGGEQVTGGENLGIVWQVAVAHEMESWDLWYSVSGEAGPWIELATVPPGDTAFEAVHTYYWLIPNDMESGQMRVKVRQNTTYGNLWTDSSSADFSISGTCCEGIRGNIDSDAEDVVDIGDLVYLVDWMFTGGPPPPCSIEANIDGSTSEVADIGDLVYLVSYMFSGGPAAVSCP